MDCLKTYIYTLSHPLTGEVRYVGKANNLRLRLYGHLNERRVNHKTNWIAKLRREGLFPKIEVEDIVDKSAWKFWEQHYISLYKSWGFNLLNATAGGDGLTSVRHSDITKMKMSISLKNAYSNEKLRKDISERLTGRRIKEETKKKLSEINSGSGNYFFGKHLSGDHKAKISEALKGRVFSKESIERMRNAERPLITEQTKGKMSSNLIGNKRRLGIGHSDEVKKIISEASKKAWAKRKEAKCQIA